MKNQYSETKLSEEGLSQYVLGKIQSLRGETIALQKFISKVSSKVNNANCKTELRDQLLEALRAQMKENKESANALFWAGVENLDLTF